MLSSTIKSVRIYQSGADIVREGRAVLQEGPNLVRISGLSPSIDVNTVRLFFPEGVRLIDLRFSALDQVDAKPSDEIQAAIAAVNKKIETKELQARLWEKNGDFSAHLQQSLEDIEAYIEKLPDRLEALHREVASLEEERTELQTKLDKALQTESLPFIEAELAADKAGEYPFEIQAFESQAGWSSLYEIHTDAKGPLQLRMRARIRQQSGEDWNNVPVTLLTGKASGGFLPSLPIVTLSIREPAPQARSGGFMGMGMMAAAMSGDSAPAPMVKAMAKASNDDTIQLSRLETEEAAVSSEETMESYILPSPKTILSGRSGAMAGAMADLKSYEVPCEYKLCAVPKLDRAAYLVASIQTKDYPAAVRGDASIYLNGIYTGKVSLQPDLSQDILELTLDRDEGIRLSREEKLKKASSSVLKGTKTIDFTYEINVSNMKAVPVKLEIQDQIPVSQDKTIGVELLAAGDAKLDPETGILTWELPLAAKETRTGSFSYRYSWPKDKQIQENKKAAAKKAAAASGKRYCPICGSIVYGAFCPECGAKV